MVASTTATFDSLLKEYLPYDLLVEEVIKRDFLLSNIKKDNSWKGGDLKVPFVAGAASSMAFGRLPGFVGSDGGTNIVQDSYVVATISAQKELWGSMIFNDRDLSAHGSLEQSFLKILPDRINSFTSSMREALSGCLLTGGHVDTVTAKSNGGAGADTITVNRPERFSIGQLVEIEADLGADPTIRAYVVKINMNTGVINLSANIDLSDADVDLTHVDVLDKIFHENGSGNSAAVFSSLASQLMAAESSTIFGQTKTDYPHLQAYEDAAVGNVATGDNAIEKIFDAMVQVRRIGKGNPTDVVMSYELYAQCLKELDSKVNYTSDSGKGTPYGWSEIQVGGPKGSIKLVAVPEMDKDKAFILDWNALKLHSNGMIERRTAPDGKQFYEVRAQAGFQYIVDHRFFGELVVSKPSHCGALSGILGL